MKTRITIKLKSSEEDELKEILNKGSNQARVIRRAEILLASNRGKQPKEVSEFLGVTTTTVRSVKRRYLDGGIENALYDRPRPGAPNKFTGKQRVKLTALACTKAPKGYAKWSLSLLADKAVQLGIVESISKNQLNLILKKNEVRPHQKRQWCLGTQSSKPAPKIIQDILSLCHRQILKNTLGDERKLNIDLICPYIINCRLEGNLNLKSKAIKLYNI